MTILYRILKHKYQNVTNPDFLNQNSCGQIKSDFAFNMLSLVLVLTVIFSIQWTS